MHDDLSLTALDSSLPAITQMINELNGVDRPDLIGVPFVYLKLAISIVRET